MKRLVHVLLLMIITLFATSCGAAGNWNYRETTNARHAEEKYNLEHAVKNHDVISNFGEFINIEKLDDFFNNLGSGKSGKVRITVYTKKDEAVLYDLNTDGYKINCRIDNTRINGSEKKIREYTFAKGGIQYENDANYYYLCNSDSGDGKLIIFSKQK